MARSIAGLAAGWGPAARLRSQGGRPVRASPVESGRASSSTPCPFRQPPATVPLDPVHVLVADEMHRRIRPARRSCSKASRRAARRWCSSPATLPARRSRRSCATGAELGLRVVALRPDAAGAGGRRDRCGTSRSRRARLICDSEGRTLEKLRPPCSGGRRGSASPTAGQLCANRPAIERNRIQRRAAASGRGRAQEIPVARSRAVSCAAPRAFGGAGARFASAAAKLGDRAALWRARAGRLPRALGHRRRRRGGGVAALFDAMPSRRRARGAGRAGGKRRRLARPRLLARWRCGTPPQSGHDATRTGEACPSRARRRDGLIRAGRRGGPASDHLRSSKGQPPVPPLCCCRRLICAICRHCGVRPCWYEAFDMCDISYTELGGERSVMKPVREVPMLGAR